MMEFPEVGDASAYGVIKPDATQALINSINGGTAILSYIGHGSPTQLAQEKLLVLDRGDLSQIDNKGKLPIWIVGTCSFGHFDDPLTESFAAYSNPNLSYTASRFWCCSLLISCACQFASSY